MREEKFNCDCGRKFETRSDLQDHQKSCVAAMKYGSGQQLGRPVDNPKTRTAGGGTQNQGE